MGEHHHPSVANPHQQAADCYSQLGDKIYLNIMTGPEPQSLTFFTQCTVWIKTFHSWKS